MLKKEHRLAKTKDVKAAFERGRAFFNPWFTIKFRNNRQESSRFTVVVSTKVSKKAVVRNRLKRVLREKIRLNYAKFIAGDYAVVVKPKAASLKEEDLLQRFEDLLVSAKLVKN